MHEAETLTMSVGSRVMTQFLTGPCRRRNKVFLCLGIIIFGTLTTELYYAPEHTLNDPHTNWLKSQESRLHRGNQGNKVIFNRTVVSKTSTVV
jgi:hypothetical protein